MANDQKTFVLLHGAWYGKWCWDEVAAQLKTQGHEVVYFDLPNYERGKSTTEITLNTYVECLHDQVRRLKKPPVIVGHSMSGIVLSQFAERYPEQVDCLIYISAFLLRDGESIWDFIGRRTSNEIGAVKQPARLPGLNGYSFPILEIDRSTIFERFCADIPSINIDRFSAYTPATPIMTKLSLGRNFQQVPKFYIKCLDDRAISVEEQEEMIGNHVGEIKEVFNINSGHFPFLLNPSSFSTLLINYPKIAKPSINTIKIENKKINNTNKHIKYSIGIIRGKGTGNYLANTFIEILNAIIKKANAEIYARQKREIIVEFAEDIDDNGQPYEYHSFQSLVNDVRQNGIDFKQKSKEESIRLENLTTEWFKNGTKTVFRTSINAEALYLFRQEVEAIKEIALETPIGGRMLIIRDQGEGFYANKTYYSHPKEIKFDGKFTKTHQQRLVKYSIKKANYIFRGEPFFCMAIFKFHLFGDVLGGWLTEAYSRLKIFQPDSGLTELINFISKGYLGSEKPKNLLVICSNEVGDLILETLLSCINLASPKNELYSRNIYLSEPFNGRFLEYQTVHGSADDLIGIDGKPNENLNPIATFRIAAEISEKILGIEGVRQKMEEFIIFTKRSQINTTSGIKASIFKQMYSISFLS